MTLLELSALYDESATRIRVRMAQLRADAKEQTDPAAAQALRADAAAAGDAGAGGFDRTLL